MRKALVAGLVTGVVLLPLYLITVLALLPIVVLVELVFAVWFCRRISVLENLGIDPPAHDRAARFDRFLMTASEVSGYMPLEAWLGMWFNGAPISEIKSSNLAELIGCNFLYKAK